MFSSPFQSLCSEGRAKLSLTLITIAVTLVNIPNFFYYTPATSDSSNGGYTESYNSTNGGYMGRYNSTNETTARMTSEKQPGYRLSGFGGSQMGFTYEFWIHCIAVLLVPWFSVFYMNVMIIFQITRANKQMADKKTAHSMERSKKSENQITRILLSATFSFIFFMGVQCVAQCYWMQKPQRADWRIVSSAFAFGKTGIVFTSALNFIFYCLTGRRFRNELLKTLGFSSKSLKYSSQSDSPTSSTQHTNVPTD
ncbi:uncharacterized protein LOC131945018 [Physella acuta]|uniref:uncharacterized protein LOC131945018 n=1 Tax=Physella acuta TaxID=109671 RepID=UPI0027DBB3B6|nr:uncharacterized protein LOC131945018 [Physella acuta]